ncbi:DUF6920 family protein [Salinirubrum litoreum]|uniref:DUF6920 family protein n=1 Tax=Salinirubrum litoreum TaxID=1126234 RepID=A0ABD5RG73_9EURY|nr:DUF6544 family protein [Salinirubrum litoreum]
MTRRGFFAALLAAGVALAGLVGVVARRRRDREITALRNDLRRGAEVDADSETEADEDGDTATDVGAELADLPPPVARYLSRVLPENRSQVRFVDLTQTGEFRTGDADSPWRPFSATQQVTTDPPGFVWEASIEMAPFVSARVVDSFVAGEGSLTATVFSAITVADAESSPELDEGELLRYLGESPWYPPALLPSAGVSWDAIDDRSARATLSVGETTASLVVHFGEDDLVTHVSGERPAQQDDGRYERTPWSGHWWAYEERGGMLVPTAGRAEWNRPTGDLAYWRGRLETVEYE